ncbi:hypothetical protein HPB52_022572 [Rhipicephalus sanguineus]|uniref:Uncharacterized protein n=1 Tax=Rhipicephalus sanguineus TaxID=34632 RepID=A0A9D4SRI3_RHISA|nr:hypothetical protein HPB52_022572 [Rhipicephalus sanguineus]
MASCRSCSAAPALDQYLSSSAILSEGTLSEDSQNAEHESKRSDATLLTASDSGGTAMVSGSLDIANFVEKQVDNFSKSVAKALESISTWTEMHSSAKAKTLLAAIKDGEFLVTIICLADMLAHTLPLSRLFQRQCIDVRTAKNALVDTMAVLDKRRVDSAETFSQLYKDAVVLADELETEIRSPRITKRQTYRCNAPMPDVESYYRTDLRSITGQCVD